MESPVELEFFIRMAWFFMLAITLLIFGYIFHYRAKILKLEKEKQIATFRAAVEAEEKQKEQIANMIHDEIIHLLIAATQNLEKHTAENNQKVRILIEQVVSSLKSIAIDLIPKTLFNFGLIHALEQHAVLLNTNEDCVIELENLSSFQNESPFSKKDEVTIYRMFLEILNNLRKHAHFSYLWVTIENEDNSLLIEFTHNGTGVTNEQIEIYTKAATGLGLKSLQSRLMVLNAAINYTKDLEASTIKLQIPYGQK